MKLSVAVFCVIVAAVQLSHTQGQYQEFDQEQYIRNVQNYARSLATYIQQHLDSAGLLEELEAAGGGGGNRGRLDLLSLGVLGGLVGTSLSKSSCQRTCPPLNGTCKYKLFRGYQCVPRTRSSGTIPNIESLRFCQQNCDFPRLCRRSLRGYVCQ